jgi:predicted RNA-binding Zn ribbon-like protein
MTIVDVTPVTMTCQAILVVTRANICDMSNLPSWYPGTESKPAPMPLLRVQAFLNTVDVEEETELLADPAAAAEWLTEAGLLPRGSGLTDADLELAREVRDCLRDLVGVDRDDAEEEDLEALRKLAAEHTARLTVGDGGVLGLEDVCGETFGDALFGLLLVIRGAQLDGTWSRLKMCANPECQWIFYDRSRNQQGNWCNMASCGNRLKNRQLRARRR